MFRSDVNFNFMISTFHCFLEFPRKLPRAKPCSDPNRVREPGEVEFDIEVGVCPVSSAHSGYRDRRQIVILLGGKKILMHSVPKVFIKCC